MISHPHRTIFVHIPKCGGQSIETSFLNDLGLSRRTRAPLLLRPNTEFENGPPYLAHLTADEYVKYFYATRELFQIYYTFSILRNPISRILSIYNYLPLKIKEVKMGFDRFLFEWLPEQFSFAAQYTKDRHPFADRFWFVRPQADYVLDANGTPLVKDIFLLEDISSSFAQIKRQANLRSDLPHINKSTSIIDAATLTNEHNLFISEIYQRDFALIGQLFGSDTTNASPAGVRQISKSL